MTTNAQGNTIHTGLTWRTYTVDDVMAGRKQGTGEEVRDVYVMTGSNNRPMLFPACNAKTERKIRKAANTEHFGWWVATGGAE